MALEGQERAVPPSGPIVIGLHPWQPTTLYVWLEDTGPTGDVLTAAQIMLPMDATGQLGHDRDIWYVGGHSLPTNASQWVDTARPDWVFHGQVLDEYPVVYNETPVVRRFGTFSGPAPGLGVDPARADGPRYVMQFDMVGPGADGLFTYNFWRGNAPSTSLFTTAGREFVVGEYQPVIFVAGQPVPISSIPPSGANHPAAPGSGWDAVELTFNDDVVDLSPEHFSIVTTSRQPLTIRSIDVEGDRAILHFSTPIPPGHCTAIRHLPTGWHMRLAALPGDVNGDGVTHTNDILALVDTLNEPTLPEQVWRCDIDGSGACGPLDILKAIDLLNGTGDGHHWLGAELPECPIP